MTNDQFNEWVHAELARLDLQRDEADAQSKRDTIDALDIIMLTILMMGIGALIVAVAFVLVQLP